MQTQSNNVKTWITITSQAGKEAQVVCVFAANIHWLIFTVRFKGGPWFRQHSLANIHNEVSKLGPGFARA